MLPARHHPCGGRSGDGEGRRGRQEACSSCPRRRQLEPTMDGHVSRGGRGEWSVDPWGGSCARSSGRSGRGAIDIRTGRDQRRRSSAGARRQGELKEEEEDDGNLVISQRVEERNRDESLILKKFVLVVSIFEELSN